MYHENIDKKVLVHRLMGFAFLGLTADLCINHKNGIRTDNRLENLEVCTRSENERHKVDVLKSWAKHLTKLTDAEVLEIRRLHKDGMTLRAIAPLFNVGEANIGHIVKRRRWKHL